MTAKQTIAPCYLKKLDPPCSQSNLDTWWWLQRHGSLIVNAIVPRATLDLIRRKKIGCAQPPDSVKTGQAMHCASNQPCILVHRCHFQPLPPVQKSQLDPEKQKKERRFSLQWH